MNSLMIYRTNLLLMLRLSRGVCNCATSTKRKLEACDADDKQSDTIIAWSLPHTADRLVE